MVKKGRGREKLENDEQGIMRERDTAALEESGRSEGDIGAQIEGGRKDKMRQQELHKERG